MGIIMSAQETINQIRLIDAKSTPRNVQKIVSYGDHVFVKVSDDEIIVARKLNKGKWAFPPSLNSNQFSWIRPALKALVKFKMIPQKAMDEHISACEKRDIKRDKEYDLQAVDRLAKQYGLTIPVSWTKAMAND